MEVQLALPVAIPAAEAVHYDELRAVLSIWGRWPPENWKPGYTFDFVRDDRGFDRISCVVMRNEAGVILTTNGLALAYTSQP